ncbi:MAG: hypothetical protein HY903_20930 [Deltaproteobacteria bacterium]|nr:hypothetical protein [Deltaproteobacteria bacterium]
MRRALSCLCVALAATLPARLAAACSAPLPTDLTPTDSSLADWTSSPYCVWGETDASGDQATSGADILGFGVTHTADSTTTPNHLWFFRLAGAPVAGLTYRLEFSKPGEVVNMDITCPATPAGGPRSCTLTCTRNGGAAQCNNNVISAYQLPNGEWAIELARRSTQLFFNLVDSSTVTAYTLNGNTVLDATTSVPGYSSSGYAGALMVHLESFSTCRRDRATEIRWRTRAERDTVGFLVHRDSPHGPQVDLRLTPGAFTSPAGARYLVVDADAAPETAYYLEEVTPNGPQLYGPSVADGACAPETEPRPVSSPVAIAPPSLPDGERAEALVLTVRARGAYLVPHGEARLHRDGRLVPLSPVAPRFFFADAPVAADSDGEAYELDRGAGLPMRSRAALVATRPAPSAMTVQRFAEHHVLNPTAPAPLRFPWLYSFSGAAPRSVALSLPRYAGGDVQISVSLSGMSSFHQPGEHHARLSAGDVVVAEAIFEGTDEQILTGVLPAGALTDGGLALAFQAIADGGVPFDIIGLNYVDLCYTRTLEADGAAIVIEADAAPGLTLSGFAAPPVVLDVTDPHDPVIITDLSMTAGAISFADVGGLRRYWIGEPQPVKDARPQKRLAPVPADYVVIYADGLGAALQPLIEWRAQQGRTVLAASMLQVADTFDHGRRSPDAIRRFLEAMRDSGLKDVLLVGSASIDPGNRLGMAKRDLVPTHVGVSKPFGTYSADDAWFVRADGDPEPFAAIGRLPAADPEALAALVAKILSYERAALGKRALLVADAVDPTTGGYDDSFIAESERTAAGLVGFELERLYAPEAGHAELLQALQQAPDLVLYRGHGSGMTWSSTGLLSSAPGSDDLAALRDNDPFFLITATCWDGQFAMPMGDALAEALLFVAPGGAIGTLASSSLSGTEAQPAFDDALVTALSTAAVRTQGELWRAMQRELAHGELEAEELSRTYNLLGDPATRLPDRHAVTAPPPPPPREGNTMAAAAQHLEAPVWSPWGGWVCNGSGGGELELALVVVGVGAWARRRRATSPGR